MVVAIATAVRLTLLFRAPVLLVGDSETYLGPAVDLERLAGFDLLQKRTPGYPLFLAAALAAFGLDLRGAVGLQHLLGVLTAAMTYLLARNIAGVPAGLIAGLATALAGHLLVYERLIMTETLFTTALTAAVLGAVAAALPYQQRRPRSGHSYLCLVATGVAIGVATLVRPVAQPLLLLPPLALLVAGAGWRRAFLGLAVVLLGYAVPVAPWSLHAVLTGGEPGMGALGQTLVGRTARHDRRDAATDSGFVFYDPALHASEADPVRLAARRMLQEAANRGSSGRAVHTRLRKELGLSEAQADRLMRDLAIEAILQRPVYYLTGTLTRFGRLWVTPLERVSPFWADRGTIIRAWEDAGSRPLLDQLSGPIERQLPLVDAIVTPVQPARLGLALPLLFALGVAAATISRTHRLALVPALGAVGLVLLSAALVGGVARYRYPEDPLIFTVVAVGLSWLAGKLGAVLSRPV